MGNLTRSSRCRGQLSAAKVRDVVLCTGYMGEQIRTRWGDSYGPLRLFYSQETSPLGSGGALRFALPMLTSDTVLVMNGDSYCPLDLNKFIAFHGEKKAFASIALVESDDSKDYGTITLDDSGRITRFDEKIAGAGAKYINAGIYLFEKEVLSMISPDSACSLEYDLFPRIISKECYGYITSEKLLDIGTPERYQYANVFFTHSANAINEH